MHTDKEMKEMRETKQDDKKENKKENKKEKEREDREEYVWILDLLPYGYPDDTRPVYQKKPIIHSVGEKHFVLLELIPKEGVTPQIHSRVYIGEGERDVIDRVKRRLRYDELTSAAKLELPSTLELIVKNNEERFIKFFNEAQPITTRFHMLEILPGIGKKLMWGIINERKKGPFKSFEELTSRVKGLHNPAKLVASRIEEELKDPNIKYRTFTR
ncbi:MAG: DUF655 domain-containing protein [Halobacteria archaeon]